MSERTKRSATDDTVNALLRGVPAPPTLGAGGPPQPSTSARPPVVAEKPKPVRQTFDLLPGPHGRLKKLRLRMSLAVDEDISVQVLLAAMVDLLLDDEDVRDRLQGRLGAAPADDDAGAG